MMRTTLSIDDQTLALLKEMAHNSKKPLRQLVNEALSLGLKQLEQPGPTPYSLCPSSLGQPGPGLNIDKALDLADELENEAICSKLEQRK
ncbi:MAG: hypothetical protein U5L00_04570 [Desulfovermiculus sp.]|nr:hypothetical protein [Desulfovermiculus sp.]